MKIRTAKFGEVECEEQDVLVFPEGLVGLGAFKRFVMFSDPDSADLIWLQSVDQPEFTLATVHSSKLGGDYLVQANACDIDEIELAEVSDAEVFLIINRVDGEFSVNLRGPLVVNAERMLGKQLVLNNAEYQIRHPLRVVDAAVASGSKAPQP